jgi:hypothetical protein
MPLTSVSWHTHLVQSEGRGQPCTESQGLEGYVKYLAHKVNSVVLVVQSVGLGTPSAI